MIRKKTNNYWIWGTIDQKSVFVFCKPRISNEYRNLSIPTAQTMRIFKVCFPLKSRKPLGGQNPSAKICAKSKWESHLPQFSGWTFPKYLRNHHLARNLVDEQRQSLLFPGTLWDGTSFGETWKERKLCKVKNRRFVGRKYQCYPEALHFCVRLLEKGSYIFWYLFAWKTCRFLIHLWYDPHTQNPKTIWDVCILVNNALASIADPSAGAGF